MANVDKEIREVENRLSRLYDALGSGKLDLHDLAPRIKELLAKQGELHKTRVVAEAELCRAINKSMLILFALMLWIFEIFLMKAKLPKERLSCSRL